MNSSHGKVEHEGNNNSIRSMHKEIQGNQQHDPSYSFGKAPVHYYMEDDDGNGGMHGHYDDGMMQSQPYQLYAAAATAAPIVPDRDAQEQQSYEDYMQYYYYVDQHLSHYDVYEHEALPEPEDPYAYYDNNAQDGYYYRSTYHHPSENHQYQQQQQHSYDHAYYGGGNGEQGNYAQAPHVPQQQPPAVQERWMPHAYTLVTLNDIPLVPQQQQQQPHPGLRPVRLPTPLLPPTPKPTPQDHEKSPIDDVQTISTGVSLSDKQDTVDKTIAFLQASTKKALQPDFSSLWKQRPLHR